MKYFSLIFIPFIVFAVQANASVLSAPRELSGTWIDSHHALIDWSNTGSETGYILEWRDPYYPLDFIPIANLDKNITSFIWERDDGLATTSEFRVRGFRVRENETLYSAYSEVVTVFLGSF